MQKNVLVTPWIYLYGRGSIPEGFIPTVTRELFYESKKMKDPYPTSVPSSTATPDSITLLF